LNEVYNGGESINMKKIIWAILVICQFVLAANVGIIPTPQQVELSGQGFRLSAKVDFVLVGNPQNLKKGREILSEALTEIAGGSAEKTKSIILEKKDDYKIDNLSTEQLSEAYSLEISPEKILIQSGTDKGLFYGLMSVTQLVKVAEDGTIPTLKILDYPDMTWRGIFPMISAVVRFPPWKISKPFCVFWVSTNRISTWLIWKM